MTSATIKSIHAQEILDSRGDPTVHCSVILENDIHAQAAVPSGASTGRFEAHELRDGDMKRYGGKGVLKACNHVNIKIAQALIGHDVEDQEGIDQVMIELDGRHNKSNLGANAILAVSLAVAKAAAKARALPFWESLRQTYNFNQAAALPTPLMNIINGGKHASTNIALQEFQITPAIDKTFSRNLEAGSEIFHSLRQILNEKKIDSDVGDEGGFAPNVEEIEDVFKFIIEAIGRAGYQAGGQVCLGLDAAATSFTDDDAKVYKISPPPAEYSPQELMAKYETWLEKYFIKIFEDGFAEESWADWKIFTAKLGHKLTIIGDDLFVTNVERLQKGINEKAANAILVKPNQIGTLSETAAAIKLAQANNFKIIISHRSGETNDTTIADLAVAAGAEYIKAGAPDRGERVAKYNRLLEIERELFGINS